MKRVLKWLAIAFGLVVLLLGSGYYSWLYIGYPDAPDDAGVLRKGSLQVDGRERSFQYYQPSTLADRPALVFVLHGSMGHGDRIRKLMGYDFEQIAEREGFVVIYPDGFEGHWNDCRRTASYSANQQHIDDDAFFLGMIDYFRQRLQRPLAAVFATGYSNGGHMSYRLALEIPDSITAVAAIAASLPAPESSDCSASGQPVSVAILNGTNDPVNPYEGGQVNVLGDTSRGTVQSSLQTARYWAQLAGVDGEPEVEVLAEVDGDPQTQVVVSRWQREAGPLVWLYTLQGSGHVVPSPDIRYGTFFGGAAGDIRAAEQVWRFFAAALRSASPSAHTQPQSTASPAR